MKFNLTIRRKRGKVLAPKVYTGVCVNVDNDGQATAWEEERSGEHCIAHMLNTRLKFIGKDGILLEGMEDMGGDRVMYCLQEWWLRNG